MRVPRPVRRLLGTMSALAENFDVERSDGLSAESGWHVDDYCRPLPPEPPGDPLPDGSWAVACALLRDYQFVDPRIIPRVYHAQGPLEGRDMVLAARFLVLRFNLAVRVSQVRDERVEVDGRGVRLWGWSYRTLEGHLEAGQMDYAVWKWLDSGEVEFRIDVISRAAAIPNPVVRLGFALFGRRMQVRFARRALQRMDALVTAELLARSGGVPAAGPQRRVRRVVVGAPQAGGARPQKG